MSRTGQLLATAVISMAVVLGAGNASAKSSPKPVDYYLAPSEISLIVGNHDFTGDYQVFVNPGFDKQMQLRRDYKEMTYAEAYGLRQIDDYCVSEIKDRLYGMGKVEARTAGKIGFFAALGQLAGIGVSSMINPLNWRAVPGALAQSFGANVGGNAAGAEESIHAVIGSLHASCVYQLVEKNPELRRLAIGAAPRLQAKLPGVLPVGTSVPTAPPPNSDSGAMANPSGS